MTTGRTSLNDMLTTLDELEVCIAQGEHLLSQTEPQSEAIDLARANFAAASAELRISRAVLIAVIQSYAALN